MYRVSNALIKRIFYKRNVSAGTDRNTELIYKAELYTKEEA